MAMHDKSLPSKEAPIKGPGGAWRRFPATMEAYETIRDFIMDEAEQAGLSVKEQMKLELGMEEAVVNVIKHAYDMPGEVWLKAAKDGDDFIVDMADFGVPFNPLTKDAVPAPDTPLEEREPGGYGIMFMKKSFAKLAYAHEPIMGKDANHLRMIFNKIPKPGA